MRAFLVVLPVLALTLTAGGALADDVTVNVSIKDHAFQPAEITVPANQRVAVTVTNDDPTPEEFESYGLKFEKIIPGNTQAVVRFGPVPPGRYQFFGDFNPATAQGVVVVE